MNSIVSNSNFDYYERAKNESDPTSSLGGIVSISNGSNIEKNIVQNSKFNIYEVGEGAGPFLLAILVAS